MENNKELSEKEIEAKAVKDAMANFYENKSKGTNVDQQHSDNNYSNPQSHIPSSIEMPDMTQPYDPNSLEKKMSSETDPDLLIASEIVELPSKGLFYPDGLKQVEIQYLTSKDEDLLTTPSFIEDGSVIDRLLQRKIVNKNINPKNLLAGDRSALILFLRTSSYGNIYKVSVGDPRNGKPFEADVDLFKLKYKEVTQKPDEKNEFSVELPMRKKLVKFKLLTAGEEDIILKNAESRQEVYGEEFSSFNTMRLKALIKEIGGNRDRSYIERFVDAMPALDAYTVRRKMLDVAPDVQMKYEFKTKDGYRFEAPLSLGVDFFFPSH